MFLKRDRVSILGLEVLTHPFLVLSTKNTVSIGEKKMRKCMMLLAVFEPERIQGCSRAIWVTVGCFI